MSEVKWYNPVSWFNLPGLSGKAIGHPSYSAQKNMFFTFGNKTIYFNLNNEKDYKDAFLSCSPLKSIITKRAKMFINGRIEVLNKNTKNNQRGEKAKLLRDILRRPNAIQTWDQFFAQFHIYIDLFGYCPILKVEPAGMEGQGEISALWCLPPWLFDVEFTGKWTRQTRQEDIYKEFYLEWDGKKTPLGTKNICLVLDNELSTDSDGNIFIPDSRVKSHEQEVTNIFASYKSRGTLITKKGAIGILSNIGKDASGPMKLKKEDKDAVQEDFRRHGLLGEEWQVIITDASLQWQSMTFPTKDMMMFEEVEDCILRLCDGIGLYPDLMGSIKKSTFANLNEAKKAQYQDHIIPDAQARIEQLSAFIIGSSDNSFLSISYDHLEVLQQSEKEKADAAAAWNTAYLVMYENGIVTKNMWCQALNLPELVGDAGNKYIWETTSVPLAVKLGVGGVQSLKDILTSQMKAEQKKQVLIIVFGLQEMDADKLAGEDEEPIDPATGQPGKKEFKAPKKLELV